MPRNPEGEFATDPSERFVRWASRRKDEGHDEVGAVLLLALVFLVAVSGMVLALANSTSDDLLNAVHFNSTRTVDNAASNAVNLAVQSIRYTPLLESGGNAQTLNASPPSYCWGSGPPSGLSNIDVWCSTVWTPSSANSRVVTLSACLASVTTDPSACALHPLLQEVVTFDDYPAGVSAPNSGQCSVFCGTSITIDSLIWSPIVPTVIAISASSGPITGQTAMTITGSGFVNNATTVNFVDANQTDNVIIPATNVTVTGPTTISVTSPAITTKGTAYYVAVSTPGGTSAHTTASNFSYGAVAPVVTGISPTSGQVQHGTSETITGSGFVNGTNGAPPVVTYTPQGGGGSFTATAVSVVGPTTITAISPATAPAGKYIVSVTTANGTSTNGPVFTNS
jgi:IPT/TIG domain